MEIDLNSDLGEGCGNDAEILRFVTSANIACGFHAGDIYTSLEALHAAASAHVRVGAHPGYPDREHFGRRERQMGEDEVYRLCVRQISVVNNLAKLAGVKIQHLKPHGALYHQANRSDAYARPIVAAAELFGLAVMGLPKSQLALHSQGRAAFIAEGFADRRYRADGALVPRDDPDAFITDPEEAVRQAKRLMREQGIRTLCVHGDNPEAVAFVQALRDALLKHDVMLKAYA